MLKKYSSDSPPRPAHGPIRRRALPRLHRRGWLLVTTAAVAIAGGGGWVLADTRSGTPAGESTTIKSVANDAPVGYETGIGFTASATGSATGVRLGASIPRSTTAVAHLWSEQGTLLAVGELARLRGHRWRSATFAEPVPLEKGSRYVVSYWFESNSELPAPVTRVVRRRSPVSQAAIRYRVGQGFPDQTGPAGDYPIDLTFTGGPAAPTPTPTRSTEPTAAPSTTEPPVTAPPAGGSRNLKNCAAAPSKCGYPDETNTGVPKGVSLRQSGSVAASRDGQVVEGLDITGEINVTASNVVIRNTRVTGGGDWVVIVRPGVTNLTIQDSELRTPPGTPQDIACVLNIGNAKPKIVRANIHSCSAGVSSGGGVVQDSYIHDMAQKPGLSHDVGIASNGTGGMTITHNTVFNQLEQTAAIAFYQDFDVQRNNLVEDNLVAGGGYCLYGGKGEKGTTSGIRFVNNRLSRKFNPNCGQYGVIASWSPNDPGNTWSGNYWDESLAVLK